MKPPADFQWRDYYCLCVVFPQPSANRWEDDNGWRVGGLRKDGGWKNRGRLGCLKNPVFQIPSAHKPPAQYVRHNAFLMLYLSAVCLSVFLWSSSARCLSSFGKHRNAAWVKSFKKQLATNCSQIPLVETSTCSVQPDMQHSSVWDPLFHSSMAACFLM